MSKKRAGHYSYLRSSWKKYKDAYDDPSYYGPLTNPHSKEAQRFRARFRVLWKILTDILMPFALKHFPNKKDAAKRWGIPWIYELQANLTDDHSIEDKFMIPKEGGRRRRQITVPPWLVCLFITLFNLPKRDAVLIPLGHKSRHHYRALHFMISWQNIISKPCYYHVFQTLEWFFKSATHFFVQISVLWLYTHTYTYHITILRISNDIKYKRIPIRIFLSKQIGKLRTVDWNFGIYQIPFNVFLDWESPTERERGRFFSFIDTTGTVFSLIARAATWAIILSLASNVVD